MSKQRRHHTFLFHPSQPAPPEFPPHLCVRAPSLPSQSLALDYDIFILTRMREFRLAGWSDRAASALILTARHFPPLRAAHGFPCMLSRCCFHPRRRTRAPSPLAVCLAVEKTGSIVSTAGLIMIISFVGLLIPKTIVLNQYGFSLLVGVAIDTFLMRPIVVPVIITLLGSGTAVNWWPTKMAPPHLSPAEEERALRCGLWEPRPTPPPPSSPRRSSSQRLPTGASWRQPAAVSLHSQSLTAMALPPPGIRGNSSPRLLASNSMRLPQGQVGMSSRSPQRLASSRTGMPGAAAAAQLATLSHTRRSPTPLQADNRAHSSYPRLSP